MSLVTAELLKAIAPKTPAATRDRFLPFLQEACERYEINTELRVAAFLATCCFESDYFKTAKEYRATKPGRAKTLQDKYWGTGYYGRGLIQLTHKSNYEAFSAAMWRINPDFATNEFVSHPELVAEPRWAVESACWFWQSNNLNRYADKGQFFAIQGLVNRGDAKKKALEYETREKLFNVALRAIPDEWEAMADWEVIDTKIVPESLTAAKLPLPDVEDQPGAGAASNLLDNTAITVSPPSIIDRISSPFITAKGKFDQLNINPESIGGSSWITTILTKGFGYLMSVIGFFYSNPIYLFAGVALVIAGTWYFSRSKDRRDARVTDDQPVQTNTTIVEGK